MKLKEYCIYINNGSGLSQSNIIAKVEAKNRDSIKLGDIIKKEFCNIFKREIMINKIQQNPQDLVQYHIDSNIGHHYITILELVKNELTI